MPISGTPLHERFFATATCERMETAVLSHMVFEGVRELEFHVADFASEQLVESASCSIEKTSLEYFWFYNYHLFLNTFVINFLLQTFLVICVVSLRLRKLLYLDTLKQQSSRYQHAPQQLIDTLVTDIMSILKT